MAQNAPMIPHNALKKRLSADFNGAKFDRDAVRTTMETWRLS
jgi:hypothetical protein